MTAPDTLRRGFALLATLALVLSLTAMPAHAAPPRGTAAVTAVESFAPDAVFAGTAGQVFTITVTNANNLMLLADPVDYINITPTEDFTIVAAEGPGDWTATIYDGGETVDFAGDTLGMGESVDFTITTNVGRPEGDISFPWNVQAANDGQGLDFTTYDPEDSDALSPYIRVLQVIDNNITGPALVTDGDATEGQDVQGETILANLGSGTLEVTPSLSSSNATTPTLAPITLGPGIQDTVTWTATLGDPGTARITADAVGDTTSSAGWPSSDAPVSKSTDDLTVLDAADLSYIDDTLSPQVVGSATATSINVTLDLENLGGVLVDPIDSAASQVSITIAGQTLTADLSSPTAIAAGETSKFTFSGLAVPAALAGEESPVVTIAGTDQNGMSVSESIPLPDTIEFDPVAPVLELVADLPTTMVNGEADAATTGTPFDVTGTVTDDGSGCGDCPVTATLVEFPSNAETPIELSNDGSGNLSATVDHSFAPSTTSAKVIGTAADGADNSTAESQADTGSFPVDLVAPSELSAVTGGPDGQDLRRIDITIDERTAFPQVLKEADFEVEGNVVTGVSFIDSRGINSNDATMQGNTDPLGDTIILTLGEDLSEDETPLVVFTTRGINEPPYDRVGLNLDGFEIQAADGLIPGLPSIDEIGGLGEYDDPNDESGPRFYTNQDTPTVLVSAVDMGHQVTIYEDVNEDGAIDGGDRAVGSATAVQSGDLEVQLDSLGLTERSLTLLSRATDGQDNVGLTAQDGLTVDLTAPEFGALSTDAATREIGVTFTETLRDGRNGSTDWRAFVTKLGRDIPLSIDDVTGEYGSRTLVISDNEDQWDGTVNRLRYTFKGSDGERFIDRAGNLLGDFSHEQ